MADGKSSFVYVTYIRTTPVELWTALTTSEFMKQYWFGMNFETDWKVGSPWKLVFPDGRVADTGEIVELDRPRRIVLKWRKRVSAGADGRRLCALFHRARTARRRREADHQPYDRARQLEADRGRVRWLAAYPVQPEVIARNGPDHTELGVVRPADSNGAAAIDELPRG